MAQWPRYPPCANSEFFTAESCGHAYKFEWPNLVGRKAEEAKDIIETDNPSVTVVILLPDARGLTDLCCNRVYLRVNEDGNVSAIPKVG